MDEFDGDPLGPPEPERDTLYGGVPKFRPVWVNVAALFPAPDPPRPLAVDGLDMSVGEAPGVVHFWTRASHGLWIASCSYTLRHLDGRDRPYRVDRQLVPETALRQRSVDD